MGLAKSPPPVNERALLLFGCAWMAVGLILGFAAGMIAGVQ